MWGNNLRGGKIFLDTKFYIALIVNILSGHFFQKGPHSSKLSFFVSSPWPPTSLLKGPCREILVPTFIAHTEEWSESSPGKTSSHSRYLKLSEGEKFPSFLRKPDFLSDRNFPAKAPIIWMKFSLSRTIGS